MDALMTWAKENYNLISLLVGIVGVIIAFISLIYELNKRKSKKADIKKQNEIKEAQLIAMSKSLRSGFNVSDIGSIKVQMAALRAEIEELKMQL